jgi:hypothetical protein
LAFSHFCTIDQALKHSDAELHKYHLENQEMSEKLSECQEYIENSKISTQNMLDKLNYEVKAEYDPINCSCHELKVEGFPPEYKCVFCIVNRQINGKLIISHF